MRTNIRRTLLSLGFLVAALPLATFGAGLGAPGDSAAAANAAMNRDFSGLRTLISQHVNVKIPQADGATALHWAAHWDNVEAIDVLLKAGADPKASTRLGATPLSIAAEVGNSAIVAKLLGAGVDPNTPFLADGETALMMAARSGSVDTVRILLDAGANIEGKDTLRETTALSWAAEQGHDKVVALLLARGAKIDAASKVVIPAAGKTPGDDDAVPDPNGLPANANAKGGISALMEATRERSPETIKVLLDAGAPINQRSGNGSTALLVALQNGDTATAKLLIDRGADVNIANAKNWSPLYVAVKQRTRETGTVPNPVIDTAAMFDVIKLMIDKGADVNVRLKANTETYGATTWLKETGATPFLRAAWCGDLAVLKLLLEHGADPFITTTDGTNPLMALSGVGYGDGFTSDFGPPEESLEAMKLLIEVGIPINAITNENEKITALHAAAHKNFVLGIQYLVDMGADLAMKSHRVSGYERTGSPGNTVLDWATGVQVNAQSSTYKAEAVELVTKLMKEHNIPVEGLTTTKGGKANQKTY